MIGRRLVAGVAFVAQTWLAAVLSTMTPAALADAPATQGTAFYDVVRASIGHWLGTTLAISVAVQCLNLGESFPGPTVFALLPEWERMLGIRSGDRLAVDARQAQLLARWRTRFAGTPQAILRALAPLNFGAEPTMRETLARESRANSKRVFAFTIRSAFDPNTAASIAPLDDVVQIMKPAHTKVAFTSKSLTGGFFCNDPGSLTNNTVL